MSLGSLIFHLAWIPWLILETLEMYKLYMRTFIIIVIIIISLK